MEYRMEYRMTDGLAEAYYMMDRLTNEGVFDEDGGICDADELPGCEWWWYTEDGYCPTQDRTYITVNIQIQVDDKDEPILKILPIGWYQGEPNEELSAEYVGRLVGTMDNYTE